MHLDHFLTCTKHLEIVVAINHAKTFEKYPNQLSYKFKRYNQ